jgi:hypothetical protein
MASQNQNGSRPWYTFFIDRRIQPQEEEADFEKRKNELSYKYYRDEYIKHMKLWQNAETEHGVEFNRNYCFNVLKFKIEKDDKRT